MEAARKKPSLTALPGEASGKPDEGHGQRLIAAFEALGAAAEFPALADSRDRLLAVAREDAASAGEVIAAVESDVALVVAVLRTANSAWPQRGKVASVPEAVAMLSTSGVEALAAHTPVYDFFERTPSWSQEPERFRLHAIATRTAADRLARELDYEGRDALVAAAMLHDIGKLVLMHAYPDYPDRVLGDAATPEERVRRERQELGVDHAVVGGVLAGRWGLPARLASAIERHHAEEAQLQSPPGDRTPRSDATLVRLADMLAHYGHGQPVDPAELLTAARTAGLSLEALRSVMFVLPRGGETGRGVEPCPLSRRELEVLRGLARGSVYKQIAQELGVSASTIRSHLHNVYAKLGASDRARAVLIATDRGWL